MEMVNPSEYMIDLGKYKDPGNEQMHFKGTHIFFNFDFNKYYPTKCFEKPYWANMYTNKPNAIHYQHRVHIFFSQPNSSIVGGGLRKFIQECKDIAQLNEKVVIHVPKSEPAVKEMVQVGLEGLDYILIFEKNSVVTLFNHEFDPWRSRGYEDCLYVAWTFGQRIATGICKMRDKGVVIHGNQEH